MLDLDANRDGVLNSSDAAYQDLRLWVDADSDGLTDAGELHGLAEMGVASMNLVADSSTAMDNGNLLGLVSSYTHTDGSTHDMADVWFARTGSASSSDSSDSSVSVDDLLAGPTDATVALASGLLSEGHTSAAPTGATTHGTVDAQAVIGGTVASVDLNDEARRNILL